jgi:hypothetical protein
MSLQLCSSCNGTRSVFCVRGTLLLWWLYSWCAFRLPREVRLWMTIILFFRNTHFIKLVFRSFQSFTVLFFDLPIEDSIFRIVCPNVRCVTFSLVTSTCSLNSCIAFSSTSFRKFSRGIVNHNQLCPQWNYPTLQLGIKHFQLQLAFLVALWFRFAAIAFHSIQSNVGIVHKPLNMLPLVKATINSGSFKVLLRASAISTLESPC